MSDVRIPLQLNRASHFTVNLIIIELHVLTLKLSLVHIAESMKSFPHIPEVHVHVYLIPKRGYILKNQEISFSVALKSSQY